MASARATASTSSCRPASRRASSSSSMAATGCVSTRVSGRIWRRARSSSGYAVAMPTYTLCPENRIAGIVAEMGQAVEKIAGMVGGPIHLTGHSAGGHLAARLVCTNSPLVGARCSDRIRNVVSISGLHDLRPLMRTAMNATLRIDRCRGGCRKPCLPGADRRRPRHLLGRRRRTLRIHPPERAARQCLDRRRRGDSLCRGARPASFQHHRRACRSGPPLDADLAGGLIAKALRAIDGLERARAWSQ